MKDGIVLFHNRTTKPLKHKKYKKSKVNAILMPCDSELFGRLYKLVSVGVYKKMLSCTKCVFSYDFIDGSVVDDDDIHEYKVKNKYHFTNAKDLISKLDEIYISENILNDSFWVYDTYYSYLFMNHKFKLTMNGKKYKLRSVQDLYKKLGYGRELAKFKECINNRVICVYKNGKYDILSNDSDTLRLRASKDTRYFMQLYIDLYIEVDYRFIRDINQVYLKTSIYQVDDNGDYLYSSKKESKFNEYDLSYIRPEEDDYYELGCSGMDRSELTTLFEHTLWKPVIESLGSRYYGYKIKTKLKKINGKRAKISLKKFLNKYFKN